MRCDSCGRFSSRLIDVPCNPPTGGIDRSVCQRCADRGNDTQRVTTPADLPDWYDWAAEEATWD